MKLLRLFYAAPRQVRYDVAGEKSSNLSSVAHALVILWPSIFSSGVKGRTVVDTRG